MHDCSSAQCSSEAEADERVAKAVVQLDDPEVIMDLRQMNENPKSTTFELFWQELQLYLDEVTLAVDERRLLSSTVAVMHTCNIYQKSHYF